jgi:hypothetical protein
MPLTYVGQGTTYRELGNDGDETAYTPPEGITSDMGHRPPAWHHSA